MINQRIERLVQLMCTKQQETERLHLELTKAKEVLHENKTKRDTLISYRREYIEQLKSLYETMQADGPLQNYIDFVQHLDKALVELNIELAKLAKNHTRLQLNYTEAKRSEEGVVKLIVRIKEMEQIRLKRIRLKEMNEYL